MWKALVLFCVHFFIKPCIEVCGTYISHLECFYCHYLGEVHSWSKLKQFGS